MGIEVERKRRGKERILQPWQRRMSQENTGACEPGYKFGRAIAVGEQYRALHAWSATSLGAADGMYEWVAIKVVTDRVLEDYIRTPPASEHFIQGDARLLGKT